jgi:hypothetical protein
MESVGARAASVPIERFESNDSSRTISKIIDPFYMAGEGDINLMQ